MKPEPVDIQGLATLAQKRSDVDCAGQLQVDLIADLRYRLTRPVAHEDGYLVEIARASWDMVEGPIVQVHLNLTLPGRVRAWGLHRHTTDRLFVASGLVRVVCYDGRTDSPTRGRLNEFIFGDRNPGLIVIPVDVYHGWKNIGTSDAIVINLPTRVYDYQRPDALHLPWDGPAAASLIPYRW